MARSAQMVAHQPRRSCAAPAVFDQEEYAEIGAAGFLSATENIPTKLKAIVSHPLNYKKSINNLRVEWNNETFLNKYALVILLLLLTSCSLFIYREGLSFVLTAILMFFLSVLSVVAIAINDKLTEVQLCHLIQKTLRSTLQAKIEISDWRISRSNNEYLIAEKNGKWLVGSKLTILFHKKSIFINVKNIDGFRGYFPFSFGRNKRIKQAFIQVIQSIDGCQDGV